MFEPFDDRLIHDAIGIQQQKTRRRRGARGEIDTSREADVSPGRHKRDAWMALANAVHRPGIAFLIDDDDLVAGSKERLHR